MVVSQTLARYVRQTVVAVLLYHPYAHGYLVLNACSDGCVEQRHPQSL